MFDDRLDSILTAIVAAIAIIALTVLLALSLNAAQKGWTKDRTSRDLCMEQGGLWLDQGSVKTCAWSRNSAQPPEPMR